MRIGCTNNNSGGNSSFTDGAIKDVVIYNTNKTAGQIATLYNGGVIANAVPADTTGLVATYLMNETSGNRVDSVGGYDATEIGTPDWISLSTLLKDNNTVGSDTIAEGYVWRMLDKSGNANHMTQDTASSQPKWINSGFGTQNKPYIQFDGVDDFMSNIQALNDSQGTLIMVVDSASSASGTFADFNFGATTRYLRLRFVNNKLNGTQRNFDTPDTFDGNTTVSANTKYIVAMASDESQYYLWVNNGSETISMTSGVDNGDWIDAITSGSRGYYIGGNTSSKFEFKMTEYLYYNVKITDAEFNNIATYLNNKYGIY
jgi:hypothetical protein